MIKLKYIIFLLPLFLLACKKEQLLNPEQTKPVSFSIKGLVLTDTLQFIYKNKVLGQVIDGFAFPTSPLLFNPGDKIQLRKKADGKVIKEFEIAANPFNQVKKIFYDGTTLSDNVTLTPVSNPDNMGCRFRFSTPFRDFYGGPVDIEIFERTINNDTYEITYRSVKEVKNVTAAFGDFIELEPFISTAILDKAYVAKVYKAGTKELPYTSLEHVFLDDPENNFSDIIQFDKGASKLISITTPGDGTEVVGQGYTVTDLSAVFK